MWELKQTLPCGVDFTWCFIMAKMKQSRIVSVMNEPLSMVTLQLTHSACQEMFAVWWKDKRTGDSPTGEKTETVDVRRTQHILVGRG